MVNKTTSPAKKAQGHKLQDALIKKHRKELMKDLTPILNQINRRLTNLENRPNIQTNKTTTVRPTNFNLKLPAIFDSIISNKFFPIEINKKKEKINVEEGFKIIFNRISNINKRLIKLENKLK